MNDDLVIKLIDVLNPTISYNDDGWEINYKNNALIGRGNTLKDAMENFWMSYSYGNSSNS